MSISVGDLVRWYHYSHDMIILDGGIGCVISFKHFEYGDFDGTVVQVLCETGEIRDFEPFALDLVH